ncbi:MAG: glycyl-radical enzyme activating protein [Clostridia bacterium]|nr:glycyl-radical enzyme activating protein [Clostridia bacterium]
MIFATKPFEIHDGDGIRTTVFFKGCPLRCKWCHNPESFAFKKQIMYDEGVCKNCHKCVGLCEANIVVDGKHVFLRDKCVRCEKCVAVCPAEAFDVSGYDITPEALVEELLRDELIMKGSGGGVTFSGGEPLMQVDFCVKVAKLLKEHGINIAIDTSAFVAREAIDKILPFADMFLFDIKAIDEDVHFACTGVYNKQILENIKYVDSLGIPMEIRYPYVPTMNDGEVEKIGAFIAKLKSVKAVRILPYHSYAEHKYTCLGMTYPIPDVPTPTKEEIATASEKMKALGVNVVPY